MPEKLYTIDSDIKVEQFIEQIHQDYRFSEKSVLSYKDDEAYHLYFQSMKIDPSKRFAEMHFVSGDQFIFSPLVYLPPTNSETLSEYLNFMMKAKTSSKTSATQDGPFFKMQANQYELRPSYIDLCRKGFYELGNIKDF